MRAMYISLNGHKALPKLAVRLRQMCGDDSTTILERIWTRGCTNPEDLLELLRDTIPRQRTATTITANLSQLRLIVLDSGADLFRADRDIPARSAMLFQVASALQDLVYLAQMPCAPLSILVLNQVTADFASSSSSLSFHHSNSNNNNNHHPTRDAWIPALGLSWAHCVHSHFQLDRCAVGPAVRRLWLAHSARHGSDSTVSFVITAAGCKLV